MVASHIRHFRELNNQLVLRGFNVLVVGGTGGIGAAAALRFAQLGASVTIAGRNKQVGAEMIEKMKAVAPTKTGETTEGSSFHFLPVDITVMADVNRFTKEYQELNHEGLNTLLVTSGGLNVGSRRDTVEGVEHNFAISYLGRFLIFNRLLPLLLKAPTARAMSVLSAGAHPGKVNLEDIEMKKDYSKFQSATTNSICNDVMVAELADKNKGSNVSFFHLAPGIVGTDIMSNNNVPLSSIITPLVKWFSTKPEDYAEVLVHIATSSEFGPEKSGGLDAKANIVEPYPFLSEPGAREAIWKYSAEVSGLNK